MVHQEERDGKDRMTTAKEITKGRKTQHDMSSLLNVRKEKRLASLGHTSNVTLLYMFFLHDWPL
jgi:hypothetical protein